MSAEIIDFAEKRAERDRAVLSRGWWLVAALALALWVAERLTGESGE